MLGATGFEDNVTLCDTCVALCWHTDVCGHPPRHSPLVSQTGTKLPSAVIQAMETDVWSSQQGGLETCHLKNTDDKCGPYNLAGRWLSGKQ